MANLSYMVPGHILSNFNSHTTDAILLTFTDWYLSVTVEIPEVKFGWPHVSWKWPDDQSMKKLKNSDFHILQFRELVNKEVKQKWPPPYLAEISCIKSVFTMKRGC